MGGPGTTDTKMPEELFDRRTHVVFSHRNTHLWQTHPRMQTTPTLRAPSRISTGIITLLLLLFATRRCYRRVAGMGGDEDGIRKGAGPAVMKLR